MYSPLYQAILGTFTDQAVVIEHFVPESLTTLVCAAAARVHAPLYDDYAGNQWLSVTLRHGQYNP
jgi:hypothetical protein